MRFIKKNLLSFVIAVAALNTSLAQADKEPEFTLVKEDDDIFIYERWTIFPKSNPPVDAREVKGVFTVKSTVQEAVALIRDEKKVKEWQSHVSQFKVYLKENDSTYWEEYSYHDIPWPVSDQDHFLAYTVHKDATPEKMLITFKSKVDPKRAPVKEDVSRMVLSGSWLFEKIDAQTIKATYSILSMPGNIPRFFTDPIIRGNMMSTIKSYKEILESESKVGNSDNYRK